MNKIFLIGGGWNAKTFPQTYGRFLESVANGKKKRIAIIIAEEEGANSHEQFLRFFAAFEAVGLKSGEAFEIIVAAKDKLSKEKLAEIKPTGVFVCGGLTPAYFNALCIDKTWLSYLIENNIPYCGFSAGASIAAEKSILGGWQREIKNKTVQIADENAGEDLELLDVKSGLGLVNFSVEVHATQWGTLSRLIHTIDAQLADKGFAVDENTALEINGNQITVHGVGNVYRVYRSKQNLQIEILQTGNFISSDD